MRSSRARLAIATIAVALAGAAPVWAWDPTNPDDPAADAAAKTALRTLGRDRGARTLVSDARAVVSDIRDVDMTPPTLRIVMPPTVRIVAPVEGQRVQGDMLAIVVEYAGEGSDIATPSFHALLNGRDYTRGFEPHSRGASGRVRVTGDLPLGENTLTVEIADRTGNVAQATTRFFNAGSDWLAVTAVVRDKKRLGPLALTADGRILAGGTRDGTVRIWAVSGTAQERASFKVHQGSVSALAFSPDGAYLASGGWDGTIHVWRVGGDQPQERAVLTGHESAVSSLAFDQTGSAATKLLSAGWDGTVRAWSLTASTARGGSVLVAQPRTQKVYAVALSPDGRWLAAGNWDGTVGLWDVITSTPRAVATLKDHLLKVFALAFAPDGSTLASGALDGTIDLWNIVNSQRPVPIPLAGHRAEIGALAFVEGGALVSAARDGVRLWDVVSAKMLKEAMVAPGTKNVAIASGGHYLAIGDDVGTVDILRLTRSPR